MSTAYPQALDIYLLIAVCVLSLFVIALTIYVGWKTKRDFPSKMDINYLRGEVSQQSGDLADLRDRFSRFQKREGLRVAREEKASQTELQEQALRMMQEQGTGATSTKADLYKKMRN